MPGLKDPGFMKAQDEYNTENWTLHVTAEDYESSYTRVKDDYIGDRSLFRQRDYLFHFSTTQLSEMTKFTQNPGW